MEQYIDKADLVVRVEKLQSEIAEEKKLHEDNSMWYNGINHGFNLTKDILNTLEVKEVDLEKALSDLDKDIKEFVTTEEFENESTTAGHYWVIAKHAFLLGLKAQKGE